MSHFYASIQGSRGEATRRGTKSSGMTSHTHGWHFGVKVVMRTDENGEDVADIYLTPGAEGEIYTQHIGTFSAEMAEEFAKHAWEFHNSQEHEKIAK